MIKNIESCRKDPSSVKRLLDNLTVNSLASEISDIFQALLREGYIFDSKEYVEPLK